jgi:stage II sporulation protein D
VSFVKGYLVLLFLSVAVILLVPLCAMPPTSLPKTPPISIRDPAPEGDNVFKVKNETTGEIMTMGEQDFLIAVVSCEMAPSSPLEALKAQAVAAYTYYCKQRSSTADGVFSNVPETFFTVGTKAGMQERWGDQYEKWYGILKDAVTAVQGQQIQYEGAPITACYHAISAGLTESAEAVWGGNYPYLQSVDSSGDILAEGYLSTITVTKDKFEETLKSLSETFTPTDDAAKWCGQSQITRSGYVKTISICGADFKGNALRTAFGLRSACFTLAFEKDAFVFTVRGYGHNVGMSQSGAKYMANQGATYKEILSHYYPHTEIL